MDPADPIHVQADEWQLLRAMANVLLHARVHMRADSSLVVDLSSGETQPVDRPLGDSQTSADRRRRAGTADVHDGVERAGGIP